MQTAVVARFEVEAKEPASWNRAAHFFDSLRCIAVTKARACGRDKRDTGRRMWRAFVIVALVAGSARAEPDASLDCDTACRIDKIRLHLDRGEKLVARTELLALYEETKQADLLFALGQVELQLEHYEAAIGYYERYIATAPGEDQIALAQQAIGAARMKITQPKREPDRRPPPLPIPRVYERRWDVPDTVLVAAGGVAILAGGALLGSAHQLGTDESGTLSQYDDRLEHARTRRFAGIAVAAAGTIAIAAAFARFGLDRTEVTPVTGGAAVSIGGRW